MSGIDEAQRLYEQLVMWRRDFHRHPEVGVDLPRTAQKVAAALRDMNYTVTEGIATSGVVGLLENGEGPVLMVRADMDALPIQEETGLPYASQSPGAMHACGHDAHIAIGLGVAALMAQTRDTWKGTLKMVFQPGEEGMNGAAIMVDEGVLENPRPDLMLALHVWSDQAVGKVSATPGPIMAAAEFWEVTLNGKGGHAAHPEETADPIVGAATIVNALQTIVSRNVGAQETAVVTVGMVQSGDTFNIIPDSAYMKGTVRTYDPEVRETVLRRLREVVEGIAKAMGLTAKLNLERLSPAVINDPETTAWVQAVIKETLGPEALEVGLQTMGSEDASYFLREIPGCYFFVGCTPEGAPHIPHHNPHFIVDEGALPVGVTIMVETLRRLMPVKEA